jgi:hypothetical protein
LQYFELLLQHAILTVKFIQLIFEVADFRSHVFHIDLGVCPAGTTRCGQQAKSDAPEHEQSNARRTGPSIA